MECIEAQELLSEVADGRIVDPGLLASVRAHCETCDECASFARALDALRKLSPLQAPEALVDGILVAVSAERERIREEAAAIEETFRAQTAHKEGRDVRASWWVPRLAILGTAAVVLVTVVTLSTIGYFGGARQLASQEDSAADQNTAESATDSSLGANSPTDMGTGGTVAEVPAYISVDGRVYLLGEPLTVDETALSTVGPVAGRSQAGTTTPVYAYTANGTDVVIDESGGWVGYGAVVREYGGIPYQLVTGTALTVSGIWPDLPAEYPVPTDSDGGPTFRFFGYDALGVRVYVPAAGNARNGFAIAPGTTSDDPAAGNPGWTWWVPLD